MSCTHLCYLHIGLHQVAQPPIRKEECHLVEVSLWYFEIFFWCKGIIIQLYNIHMDLKANPSLINNRRDQMLYTEFFVEIHVIYQVL